MRVLQRKNVISLCFSEGVKIFLAYKEYNKESCHDEYQWCCNTSLSQQVDSSGAIVFCIEGMNHLSRATKLLSATSCRVTLPSTRQQFKQIRMEENPTPAGGLAHLLAATQTRNLVMVTTKQKALAEVNVATQTECLPKSAAALAAENARVCCWWWRVAMPKSAADGGGWQWCHVCEVWAGELSAQYDGRAHRGGGEIKEHQWV